MGEYRDYVLVCFFVVLLSGQIGVFADTATSDSDDNSGYSTSSITITNYVEDPYFSAEPEIVVEGTSNEFSSSFHQAIDDSDFNYQELTWEHTANTSLNFSIDPFSEMPDCFDFIYMYQEFEWLYNEIPLDVELQINFTSSVTGSFAIEEDAQTMFEVYVWLIDSSGDWDQIYRSYPPHPAIYQESVQGLNYFGMHGAFGGMIENATGYQEDPEDTVKIAVGLAPTHHFEDDIVSEDDPWEFYNGAVNIRIKSLELYGYYDEDPDPSLILSPLYNNTWNYSALQVFPDIPVEYANSIEYFTDIVSAPDGSIYILCESSSSYELYGAERKYFSYQFLLKYNSELELLWARHNQNDTGGHGMTYHNGYIYTTGYIRDRDVTGTRDVLVTKWSANGDVLWETKWGGFALEEGASIGVSSDGSIYVWASYWDYWQNPDSWKSCFLKFSSSGTFLWNKTFDFLNYGRSSSEIEMKPDGMYSWNGETVEKRDFLGELSWNISLRSLSVNFDESGNIYITSEGYGAGQHSDEWQLMLSKWNPNGEELWHSNYTFPKNDGRSWIFKCRAIDVAPDGSIIALLHGVEIIHDYHLMKFDPEGNLLWDKIVGDERWPYPGAREPKLEIGDNGLAYLGFNRIGDFRFEIGVSAFLIGPIIPYTPSLELSPMIIIVGISGATIGIVAAVIYIRKYR